MAGDADAVAVCHRGVIVLDADDAQHKTYLCHLITNERVELGPGQWDIEYDDTDGFAFLALATREDGEEGDDDDCTWADSLLNKSLYETPDGTQIVLKRLPNGDEMVAPLATELQLFRRFVLKVRIGQTRAAVDQHVAIWEMPCSGSRVFWRLTDLYTIVGFEQHLQKSPSQWLYRRWQAFDNFLQSIGCPCGLLRSMAREGGDQVSAPVQRRVLPFVSCPTYAMLALLGRLAWSRHAMDDAGLRQGVAEYCEGVLRALTSAADGFVRFAFDADASWHPPRALKGRPQVIFELAAGVLNLSPLVAFTRSSACRGPAYQASAKLAEALEHAVVPEMTVTDVFRRLAQRSCDNNMSGKLFGQLCFALGSLLETGIAPDASGVDSLASGTTFFDERITMETYLDSDTSHERDLKVARYVRASVGATKGATSVSISVDASRIGTRSLFQGCMALGSNLALWMVPQALGARCKTLYYRKQILFILRNISNYGVPPQACDSDFWAWIYVWTPLFQSRDHYPQGGRAKILVNPRVGGLVNPRVGGLVNPRVGGLVNPPGGVY